MKTIENLSVLSPWYVFDGISRARSNGRNVALERTWKRAWHGSSLHRIEEIAQKGLKVGKKGNLGL